MARFSRRYTSNNNANNQEDEDDEFNDENLKSDSLDDEPSEEFEQDLRDNDVKHDTNEKTTSPSKHISNETNEDDEDDGIKPYRTRARKPVNYNEDALLGDLDAIDGINDDIDNIKSEGNNLKSFDNDNDDDDDFQPDHNKRRSNRRIKKLNDDDDFQIDNDLNDEFNDNYISDDDDFELFSRKRKRQSNFIVNDEYDGDADDDEYDSDSMKNSKNRSKNKNNNKWKKLAMADSSLDIDNNNSTTNVNNTLTLDEELKDLQNDSQSEFPADSANESPNKRNLRHRKEINYKLPPPDLSEAQLEELGNQFNSINNENNGSPKRNRSGRFGGLSTNNVNNNHNNNSVRRLFPTVGPFGGSEVQSLFPNSNFNSSNLAALANAESSDSDAENDLIKPTDPNTNNIIKTSTDTINNSNNKKKNTLADTDPLGIDTNINFSNIGGLENYINQLKEMITLPLLYPEVYSKFHITPPRGVLFHGPPGTGKTLMARALASSCSSQNKKITFFMRKGADCLSKWVGEAERHLRLLFEEAKQQQPSIIFFDEIDGLAPVRSSKQEQIHASIVSTLLALMDGMDNRGQVIIIGATNRPDSIDPALRRPGRFDREFYFPLPNLKSREEILNIHMNKWDNKLDDSFIKELAKLTKGYGGADLKALCTESALNSIQRSFPEIYETNNKLKIDINKIKPIANDFTRALKKIIPNSSRSTSNISQPLPNYIKPLLNEQFENILKRLNEILPIEKEITLLEESKFENLNNNFQIQQFVKNIESMRIFKPRLVINGKKGQGLKYLSNSILNKLDGFTIQVLDLNKIFSDSSISIENLITQIFSELKRHLPSILFIPDTIEFLNTLTDSIKSIIKYSIKNLNNNDKILIYCEVEGNLNDYLKENLEDIFDIDIDEDLIEIRDSNDKERELFFDNFWNSINLTPNEYNDIIIRPKKKEINYEIIKIDEIDNKNDDDNNNNVKLIKKQAKSDMRLKNTLKVRLSGLLDIFKIRYKRFKRPIIDDHLLVHLFDEIPDPNSDYIIKNNKIYEISTNKYYNNMDLEVIEERLWNGYYNEPKEFLNDLELILKDCNTNGDRDRILKANEMYAHAIVGVEEIEVQFPLLIEQWKDLSRREKILSRKQKESLIENTDLLTGEKNLEDNEVSEKLKDIDNITKSDDLKENESEVKTQTQVQTQAVDKITAIEVSSMIDKEQVPIKPFEISNEESEAKLEAEKKVEEESGTQGQLIPVSETNTGKADEEQEPEFIPEVQQVIFDENKVNELKQLLIAKTVSFRLSKLEKVNSKLCDKVWTHRLELDKFKLLEDLEAYINNIQ